MQQDLYYIEPSEEEDKYILINHEEAPILSGEKTQTLQSGSLGLI